MNSARLQTKSSDQVMMKSLCDNDSAIIMRSVPLHSVPHATSPHVGDRMEHDLAKSRISEVSPPEGVIALIVSCC
jgi:hypothetical protein